MILIATSKVVTQAENIFQGVSMIGLDSWSGKLGRSVMSNCTYRAACQKDPEQP
jgi:hypothetical protein